MKPKKIIWSVGFLLAFFGGIFMGKSKLITKNAGAKIYSIGSFQADKIGTTEVEKEIKEEAKWKIAEDYLKIEDCIFKTISFSNNLKLKGVIKDISMKYVFHDILLEATFYDRTGTVSLYSYRFYVQEPSIYDEFQEILELPSNIAKSNVGRVAVEIIDFKMIEKQ